jgi:threonine dehydrogenase-like Zn-dependent dehydrogenase
MGSRNATLEDFHYVVDTLKCKKVDLSRYITHRAQFDQLIEQFEDWLTPEANVIKAIVEI